MHPPHISLDTWWVISALATVAFYAVCLPAMPSRSTKSRVALAPAVGAALLAAAGQLRGHGLEVLLSMYATGLLVFPLAIVGNRRRYRAFVAELEKSLTPRNMLPPARVQTQMCAAACGMLLVWVWLRWG